MAVAAATLALAAPALPAHAESDVRRSMRVAADLHCRALADGHTWRRAVEISSNSDFGLKYYPAAKRLDRKEGGEKYGTFMIREMTSYIKGQCPDLEERAWSAHQRWRDGGRLPSPTYSGGSTAIQEDPFEF